MSVVTNVPPPAQRADTLLSLDGLGIASRIGGRHRTIVSGVDLTVGRGETVGVVGESGSGKSMTARALVGLLPPGLAASGQAVYQGCNVLTMRERELIELRGSGIGMVYQDPFTMLNPLLRCGDHVTETLRDGLGRRLSRAARRQEAVRRLAEVGIADPHVARRYPFQLSGGMRQRVGIAAALAGNPQLLIADEPSTALDVTTQKEILALLKSLQRSRGMGLILITHDLRVAFSMCDRLYVLYAGSVLEVGPAKHVEAEPLHPYTLGLLLSEPPADRRLSIMPAIGGSVPNPDEVSGSCSFAPRCRWAQERCLASDPALATLEPGRLTACIRVEEIRRDMEVARKAPHPVAEEVAGAEASDPLVHVDGVTKVFRGGSGLRRDGVRALEQVTLAFAAGESAGLVGESGSGKTTLGRCLVGLETPTAGRIVIDGIDAADYGRLSDRDRRRLRRTIQMIFQDPYSSLNPTRTVGATLQEALVAGEARQAGRGAVEELLQRVGLPAAYARRKPIALSGGERQRVAIARALAVRPRVIVCDEPVSALDVSVQAQILNLLTALRDDLGVSYLFITHDLAVVRQVVERVFVLYGGHVVEQGPVADVLDRPSHPYTAKLVRSVPTTAPGWLES